MSLSKADHIIKALTEEDSFFLESGVGCWEKKQAALSIYLFTQVFPDENTLLDNYKLLRDHVAVSFQSQDTISSAERWNLYLVYLVIGQVSETTKQLIEQDKFSTRKIVSSDLGELNDEIIARQIDEELFQFNFTPKKPAGTSLETLLSEQHREVYKALTSLGSADTYEAIDPLLDFLKNE